MKKEFNFTTCCSNVRCDLVYNLHAEDMYERMLAQRPFGHAGAES